MECERWGDSIGFYSVSSLWWSKSRRHTLMEGWRPTIGLDASKQARYPMAETHFFMIEIFVGIGASCWVLGIIKALIGRGKLK